MSRADGVTAEELAALANPVPSGLFTERECAALAYAEEISNGNTVKTDSFNSLRRHFSADEIVELTATIIWQICAAKFNRALEIGGQGIGAVCPLPGV